MKKILILSANPKRTVELRLEEEVRDIELGLERSRRRDQFEIKTKWAVRWKDVRRAVMDIEPQVQEEANRILAVATRKAKWRTLVSLVAAGAAVVVAAIAGFGAWRASSEKMVAESKTKQATEKLVQVQKEQEVIQAQSKQKVSIANQNVDRTKQ
jgi:anti-sigma-K factor RskA